MTPERDTVRELAALLKSALRLADDPQPAVAAELAPLAGRLDTGPAWQMPTVMARVISVLAARLGVTAASPVARIEAALREDLAPAARTWVYTVDQGDPLPDVMPGDAGTGVLKLAGSAQDAARFVLDRYLCGVADDAGLPLGEAGSGPCSTVRVAVWDRSPGDPLTAAAVLYHPADTPATPDMPARLMAAADDAARTVPH